MVVFGVPAECLGRIHRPRAIARTIHTQDSQLQAKWTVRRLTGSSRHKPIVPYEFHFIDIVRDGQSQMSLLAPKGVRQAKERSSFAPQPPTPRGAELPES